MCIAVDGNNPATEGGTETAHDLERLSRSHREAKRLASLNHLSIAAIYGFEEDAGRDYLVIELVLGEALKDGGEVDPDIGSTGVMFRK